MYSLGGRMSSLEFLENVGTNNEWYDEDLDRKGISGQAVMLFLYSAVVGFALLLVISKNFETPEQIMAEERMAAEGRRANEQRLAVSKMDAPEVYEDESSIDESFDNPSVEWSVQGEETQPEVKDDVFIVEDGDNIIGILQKIGMEYAEASQVADSLKKAGFDFRSLRPGQKINLTKNVDVPFGELLSVDKIVIEPTPSVKYTVTRNEDEKYVTDAEQQEMVNENRVISGAVNYSNLSAAMSNAGVPANIVSNFANIFRYKVNFRSDIRAGDTFKVLYDRKMTADGRVYKNGNILYAELNLGKKKKISLYRYKDSVGNIDYYDENGMALKRGLVRKPLEFSSARVSSRFGWRRHPILKQRILHSGVDYAAPMGSRIYASGDGVVQRSQWVGGYGRYVVIKHNSEYSTGYAHMSGFARGIKPGVRVKQGQVIGYVGSTGRSTGPHLHFEVIKNGKKVDPLKIQAATGNNLTGKELQRFKAEIRKIVALAEKQSKLASSPKTAGSTNSSTM